MLTTELKYKQKYILSHGEIYWKKKSESCIKPMADEEKHFNAQVPTMVDTINTLNCSQLCLLATCFVSIKYLIIEQRVKGDSKEAEFRQPLIHLAGSE